MQKRTIKVEDIIAEVKRVFGDYDLKSKSRKRQVVWARQVAMYLIAKKTVLSLHKIGSLFNRDHSTVIYSKKRVEEMLEYDKEFREMFNEINI